MPIYDITSPKTGRIYRVSHDQEPTEEAINKTVSYYDALAEEDLINPQRASQQPEDTGQGRLSSAASNVGRGALSVIPGTIGGVGYLTGSDTLVGAAKDVEQGIEEMLPVNPAYQEEFSQKAANVLGQAGGMLLTGGAAGAIGKGRALAKGLEAAAAAAKGTKAAQAASLGTGMLQGTYGGGQEAEKYGMTGGSAYARALLGGALEGATEKYLFGMGTELAPVRKFLGDTVESGIGSILKSAGTEAGEEVAAQIGGNVATTALAPTGVATPDVLSGVGEAALLGGIAGGALGGVNNLVSGGQAPTVEGTPVEEAPEPIDPLVAQARAAMAEEVTADDLVQSAQERFGILQAKAADQTTPLTQEETDEMEALTEAFADPANIDPTVLADMYNMRIAQPVADEVAPVDRATEIQTRLAEIEAERGPRDETTFTPDGTPVTQPYRINTTEEDALLKELDALNQAPVAPAQVAPAPNPIAQNAINAANQPDANLPATAALLNQGALNPAPTETQENAPTQERQVESPSGTPPVQGQPPEQGANRQASEGTAQREGQGAEVAPTEVVEPEQMTPEELYSSIAQERISLLNQEISEIKKGRNNPKSKWYKAAPSEIATREKEVKKLSSPYTDWSLVVTALDKELSARRPVSKVWGDLLEALRLPKEFQARIDKAGYVAEGQSYVYKPEGAEVAPAEQGPQFNQGGQANTAQDAEYLELAKNPEKNRSLLQKMVDAAAKAAGFDPEPLWHRTWSKFTEFALGGKDPETTTWRSKEGTSRTKIGESGRAIFLSYNKEKTPAFHQYKKDGERFIEGYAKMNDPLVIDDDTRDFAIDVFADGFKDFPMIVTEEARASLIEAGHDSVHLYYKGRTTQDGKPDEVILLDPNQIKSADPVTYDADGNVIPLSQRFNKASPDIRFSQGGQATTQNQSPESLRHAELEAKFKAGTITPEETKEAEKLVAKMAKAAGAIDPIAATIAATSDNDTGAYHYGDAGIGRDTVLKNMGYGRSTGHFGTGTYFLGKKDSGARSGRSLKYLDLSGLNMAKPTVPQTLHDALRVVNKIVLGGEKPEFSEPRFDGSRAQSSLWAGLNANRSEEEIKNAIVKTYSLFDSGENDGVRSPSTYVMQFLGYDGIDVRGTTSDNTDQGSVVYPPLTDGYWHHGKDPSKLTEVDLTRSGQQTNEGSGAFWVSSNPATAKTYQSFRRSDLPYNKQVSPQSIVSELESSGEALDAVKNYLFRRHDTGVIARKLNGSVEERNWTIVSENLSDLNSKIATWLEGNGFISVSSDNTKLKLFLFYKNPLKADGGGKLKLESWEKLTSQAKEEGKDAIVVTNTVDTRGTLSREQGQKFNGTSVGVFNPSQIKSADTFTGVPLDQRFNKASPDIRFSQNDQAKTAQDAEYNRIMARYEGTPRIAFIKKRRYSPIVRDLLNRRKNGENIPAYILDRATREYFPSAPVAVPKSLQDIPSQETVESAITSDKLLNHKEAMAKGVPTAGSKITVRQDVPAMDQNGVGVVTTRTENGTFYLPATRFYDPVFKTNEVKTLKIGLGEGKDPAIAILGKWSEDQSVPEDLENWTQVGFNPDRHSYYYERGTDRQVIGGSEAFQIGNTVFVKDVVFGNVRTDISYSQGQGATTSLPAAKVKTVVDQVMAKNKSPLQVRVITRDELENSPEFQDVRDALENQGADSQFTEAWVDDRTQTVVVVADSFSSAARIREVLVHEIIGHAGVDAFASEADISRVLKILDRRVPDLVKQVRSRYPNLNEAGIAREVIAKFSEQYQSADFASLPSGMKALWRELKAWLGGIIQRLNVNIAAFDDLTLNWFYTNAVNAAAGITPLPAPTARTAAAAPVAAAPAAEVAAEEVAPEVAEEVAAPEVAPAPEAAPAPEVAPAPAPAPAPAAKKKIVLPPARIRKKAAPAEAENAIGVANAVVDAARAKIGLAPVYAPARQSFGALWDQALRALVMNPKRGEELVEDLNKKPKEISPLETAILTHELVTRTLNFDRATEALNNATESEKEKAREDYDRAITKLQEAWNASDVSGTEQGRSLNARKMLVALDYTLAKMVSMRTAAAERPLNPEQRAQTEELFAKIDALQKKLNELEKSGKPSGEEARLEDLLASAREEGKLEAQKEAKLLEEAAAILKAEEAARAAKIKKGADAAKVLEDSVDAARARLRARKGLFGAKTPEVVQEEAGDIQIKFSIADTGIVGLSAQDIADLTLVGKSYVAEGATTLESWSEKMVAEFGEDITDYLEPLYENSKAPVAAAPAAKATKAPKEKAAPAEKAPKEKKLKASPMERIKAEAKEGKELSPKLVYELVKQKLQEGISGVEDVFKAVTKDLQEEFPLMTEREIRDIFSGYGVPIHPSQEDLAKKIRELRRLSQLTSALEDAKAFILPLKSRKQRDAVSDAIRDLQKEITRVMQENNLVRATTSSQLKSTLDSLKTRLRNQITDLNVQIKKEEKAPKKAGVVYDQEANDLRAERNRLQEILNGIVGPSQPSPSQRIRQRVNQLQKEITDLEKKVATRDITKRATQSVPETQLIQVLKDQRDALLEQLHVIRVEIEGDPSLTQEQVNERAEKAIQRNIKDLERRITEKDFSRESGKQASGPVVEQLRAQRDALREQYNILRETIEGKREKTYQQRIDMADKALDKSIAELNRQIDTGDIAVRPKGAPIETPNLKAKRARRDALKTVRDNMRRAAKAALADPVAKQLARDKKNIARQIEKLRTKIANRDFSKPTKIVRTTDLEKQNLEAKLEMLKSDWMRILFEEKLANRTTTQKLLGGVSQTLNTARAVLTSFDFSGVLRQGGFIVLGNPLRAIKNLRPMFEAFASKDAETKAKLELRKRPNFALYQRDKLFLADMDATPSMAKQEENYASLWVDKIPKLLGGGLIRGSQRGYVTFLNNLRADSYDAMLLAFRKGPVATPEESKAIADYINIATGRGSLGKFSQAAEGLNTVFFAPRLVASRFQLLLGMPYFSASGRTKNLVLQEYAKFLTGVAVVYMLGMLAQEDEDKPIETDPRSTNFGKIRFGDSRIDPLSGLQQATVLLARLASGQTKTSTGKIVDIRGENVPYGGATPVNILAKFARSKLSPVFGSVTNMIQGENVIGEKVTPFTELERMVVPMSFGEVGKVMEEQGVPKGMVISTLALFGMGVQTYDETKKR